MIRALAKRLPHPLLMRVHQRYQLAQQSALARQVSRQTGLPMLETLNLASLKTSDTVFVLGSGSSINAISEERWKVIQRHDSIAMNFWLVHPFVPRLYLLENVPRTQAGGLVFDALQGLLRRRAQDYSHATKIISEVQPVSVRQLVLEIPDRFRPSLYVGYSGAVVARNERELDAGLRYLKRSGVFSPGNNLAWHYKYQGSVTAAISIAVRMNYRRIILCGVDLGNAEYFYQDRTKYPEAREWEFTQRNQLHLMARRYEWGLPSQIVLEHFKREILDSVGIELFVENSSSALYPRIPAVPACIMENSERHCNARSTETSCRSSSNNETPLR